MLKNRFVSELRINQTVLTYLIHDVGKMFIAGWEESGTCAFVGWAYVTPFGAYKLPGCIRAKSSLFAIANY